MTTPPASALTPRLPSVCVPGIPDAMYTGCFHWVQHVRDASALWCVSAQCSYCDWVVGRPDGSVPSGWCTHGLLPPFGCCTSCRCEHVCLSTRVPVFCLGMHSTSGVARSHDHSIFNSAGNRPDVHRGPPRSTSSERGFRHGRVWEAELTPLQEEEVASRKHFPLSLSELLLSHTQPTQESTPAREGTVSDASRNPTSPACHCVTSRRALNFACTLPQLLPGEQAQAVAPQQADDDRQ